MSISMPGVLVRPLQSAMLKPPPFENHASSDSLFKSLPSDLDPHDLSCSRYLPPSPLGPSPFHTMDFCHSPPSSPSDIGSPRFLSLDSRDELGQKVFLPRSVSKLGGAHQSFMALVEEGGLENDGSILPGCNDLCDNVGGLSIPLQRSASRYTRSNSCVGSSFGSTNSNSGLMVGSPVLPEAMTSLQRFLPSNNDDDVVWPAMDVYSCDDFRMYEFKVRRCMRGRSHDWTECPFAHPGEKARRRDPRRIHYSGVACPDFRKGSCKRGDACEYAHGVFECWLHPARYRTQPCKDGKTCKRRVCFFAHTLEQLRVLPARSSLPSLSSPPRCSLKASSFTPSYDGSPLRQAMASSFDSSPAFDGDGDNLANSWLFEDAAAFGTFPRTSNHQHLGFLTGKAGYGVQSYGVSSPTSTLIGHSHSPPPLSPPLSPAASPPKSPDASTTTWPNCLSSGLTAQPSAPLSALIPAHRRHLDKLQSVPTVSIPARESADMDELGFSPVASMDTGSPPHAMTDLLTTLQNLRLKGRVADVVRMPSPQWSMQQPAFQHVSRSLPCTPTKSKWACQTRLWDNECEMGVPAHRVESGRDLRAEIYGKIGKENGVENEAPDLGWVNELVK